MVHRLLLYHLGAINVFASFEGKCVCIGLTVAEIHTLQRVVGGSISTESTRSSAIASDRAMRLVSRALKTLKFRSTCMYRPTEKS